MNLIFRTQFIKIPMIGMLISAPLLAMPQETQEIFQPSFNDDRALAQLTANQGIAQLLLHNDSMAIENFENASLLLNQSNLSSPEMAFIILFGEIVALDLLGHHAQAMEMLEQLHQLFLESEPSDENDPNPDDTEDLQAIELMKNIARLAPSSDIQKELFSYFDIANHETILVYGTGHQFESHKHSSRFWKKIRKICKEVLIKIISKYVEDWLKSHDYN